ncbi:hypothetical protein [Tenacibaculum halocynthiae]|uniref:hypothetical protein n=1 Tax=Tenacibaculum halocynthiae TaxID=1254437 RepID=UPI0038B5C857
MRYDEAICYSIRILFHFARATSLMTVVYVIARKYDEAPAIRLVRLLHFARLRS